MSNTITPERVAEIRAKGIDFSDIPELTREDFERGRFRNWKPVKKAMTMKMDVDLLDALRKSGKGWQTRVNDYLRKGVASGQL